MVPYVSIKTAKITVVLMGAGTEIHHLSKFELSYYHGFIDIDRRTDPRRFYPLGRAGAAWLVVAYCTIYNNFHIPDYSKII